MITRLQDRGHSLEAPVPLKLRRYEIARLPDPGQCVDALIIVNDRLDGIPRAKLALSNGASWDTLAVMSDVQPHAAVDVRPLVQKAVADAKAEWAQRMAAAQAAPPTLAMAPAVGADSDILMSVAAELARLRQDLDAAQAMLGEATARISTLETAAVATVQPGAPHHDLLPQMAHLQQQIAALQAGSPAIPAATPPVAGVSMSDVIAQLELINEAKGYTIGTADGMFPMLARRAADSGISLAHVAQSVIDELAAVKSAN